MPNMVTVDVDGPVAAVTLNRPDALNAISGALADELSTALRDVGARNNVWVMVLRAAGDKAFCVGADLKERASFSLEEFYVNRKQMRTMFEALRGVRQPTIASVFGYALGGGFELALSCDVIVAADDAVFGLPEARVGLIPAGGATQLLPRVIGSAHAKELIFTGRRFGAEEGRAFGVVARVVARKDLDDATRALAHDVCRSSPVAVREAKGAIDAALGAPIKTGIEREHEAWERVVRSDDRAEGIEAFNEKRDPRWRNH
jgi:enoyl-CoA hydratase/carnithine racemase